MYLHEGAFSLLRGLSDLEGKNRMSSQLAVYEIVLIM